MITTIIKCLPARRGALRTWAVTQTITGRPPRTLEIIARTGTDALAVARQAMGLDTSRRIRDLITPEAA